MHEFEDERPIPLGRAMAAATTQPAPAGEPDARPDDAPPAPAARPASEPAPRPVEVAAPPVAATRPESATAVRPAAYIEKTRAEAVPQPVEPATTRPADATPPAPPTIAVAEPPVVPQPATVAAPVPAAGAAHAPDEHPLAGLGGFRFQVELAEPALPVRDLGRFLIAYVVVAAFVLGLIVAFLALTTNLGSGRP